MSDDAIPLYGPAGYTDRARTLLEPYIRVVEEHRVEFYEVPFEDAWLAMHWANDASHGKMGHPDVYELDELSDKGVDLFVDGFIVPAGQPDERLELERAWVDVYPWHPKRSEIKRLARYIDKTTFDSLTNGRILPVWFRYHANSSDPHPVCSPFPR
jgi:hypothetical protein